MAIPKLSSEQESAIEALIQHSFGAQFLYVPRRFKKGNADGKEPCDLMWFGNGVLVLFFLKSGKKSFEKLDKGNLNQARGWNSYWGKNPSFLLSGVNRFGDEINIPRDSVKSTINISVVPHPTGITFHDDVGGVGVGFTCTIPERLIPAIASFNGTVVDLLGVIHAYSLLPQLPGPPVHRSGLERLAAVVNERVALIELAKKMNGESGEKTSEDFSVIHGIIERCRLPYPLGEGVQGSDATRGLMAKFFSDLSARDYAVIALLAKQLLVRSDGGKYSCMGRTNGLHLDWVVLSTNIHSRNMQQILESFTNGVASVGGVGLPQVVYGNLGPGFDHRGPLLFTLPRGEVSSQAATLVSEISARVHPLIARCRSFA